MACPIASVTVVVAVLAGARALLLEDRRYRVLTWVILAAVVAGWSAYYLVLDTLPFRIGLEVFSSAGFIAAVLRIRWLIRFKGMSSPLLSGLARFPQQAWRAIGSPWLVVVKVWLVAMVVMEWRGKANFSALEYTVVSGVLVATAVGRYLITRRARPRFAGLEALASRAAPATCPFGFGCDSPTAAQSPMHHTAPTFAPEPFAPATLDTARQA